MSLFKKNKKKTFEVSDDFIVLIKVANENPEIKNSLNSILSLDSFNRKSALNTWIEELQLKKAPVQLINGINCLLDDKIAEKVKTLINLNKV